jgi:hypothetical protein
MDGAFTSRYKTDPLFRPRLEEWPELNIAIRAAYTRRSRHSGRLGNGVQSKPAGCTTRTYGTKRDIDDIEAAILKVRDNFDELL